ncbi:hypothetical protein GIB67_004271 [Kingdonia uniflora]|uniref:AD domain-containing protein n=1 Tax=Kingdonia uniflora TaxID=39325 RepID=A0A7J7MR25_9MAGN|nr:hypothetical protein GIB67_004271 [Kingdonia uniflora]
MDSSSEGGEIAVGCHLAIKTTLGEHIEAQVLTFDRPSNFLVLQEGTKSGNHRNIRILNASYIKEFTLLGQSDDHLNHKKCHLDFNALQSREENAIRLAELAAERIGMGVSSEAQRLFDALFKTLPVRWDRDVIVVMNEVRVSSPYLPENVNGGSTAAKERVKKVLELERKRLQGRGSG